VPEHPCCQGRGGCATPDPPKVLAGPPMAPTGATPCGRLPAAGEAPAGDVAGSSGQGRRSGAGTHSPVSQRTQTRVG
jgi:hypothetical protein